MPTVAEDQAIRAAAKNDLDAWPLMPAQLKTMHSIDALQSSRPKSGNKKLLVPVRQGPEVIEYFKSTGSAWQAKIDRVLKRYVAERSRGSERTPTNPACKTGERMCG